MYLSKFSSIILKLVWMYHWWNMSEKEINSPYKIKNQFNNDHKLTTWGEYLNQKTRKCKSVYFKAQRSQLTTVLSFLLLWQEITAETEQHTRRIQLNIKLSFCAFRLKSKCCNLLQWFASKTVSHGKEEYL